MLLPLLLAVLLPLSDACFAWGGCGFGGCGISPCGPFCRRALAAKTLRETEETTGDPDSDFRQCCSDRGLPKECVAKCNYKRFTRDAMISMFLRIDACPLSAAVDMQRCASRGDDHVDCCKRNAVHTTGAGDKCLLFCRPDTGNSTILDVSYLPCLDRFDSVNSCFWHDAVREIEEREEAEDEGSHQGRGEETNWDMARRRVEETREDVEYEIFEQH